MSVKIKILSSLKDNIVAIFSKLNDLYFSHGVYEIYAENPYLPIL